MTLPNSPRSINWVTGMLLTPDHFLRQDARTDELVAWLLRYGLSGAGLIGGGLRADGSRVGLGTFDPQLDVRDDGSVTRIAVKQVRGITTTGDVVEISEQDEVHGEFAAGDLPAGDEPLIFVARTGEWEEDLASVGADAANPDQAALRRPCYEVRLGSAAEPPPCALVAGRIRRAGNRQRLELDNHFIPACVSILAHSALYNSWTNLWSDAGQTAGRYLALARTASDGAEQLARRGVDTTQDRDVLTFAATAAALLDDCALEIRNPTLAPAALFGRIERTIRRLGAALDVSAGVRALFAMPDPTPEDPVTLDEIRQALSDRPEPDAGPCSDLRAPLEAATQALTWLARLASELEARYTARVAAAARATPTPRPTPTPTPPAGVRTDSPSGPRPIIKVRRPKE